MIRKEKLKCEMCGKELNSDWLNAEEYWDITGDGKVLCEKCLVLYGGGLSGKK